MMTIMMMSPDVFTYDGVDNNDDNFEFDDVDNNDKEYLMLMMMMMIKKMIPMSRLVLDHREGSFFHCPSQKQELHVSPGLKRRACESWA